MTDPISEAPGQGWRPLPRGLVALVLLMVGIELVLTLADRGILLEPSLRLRVFDVGAFANPVLYAEAARFPAQPITMFVTYALLHGGLLHLAMNVAVLLGLGRLVADRYGDRTVLPLFLVTAIAGGFGFALLGATGGAMVGASGAVFGFLGVWTAWDWARHRAHGAPVRPVVMRAVGLVLVNVILFAGLGGLLAWEAHLGGYLAGLAIGAWLEHALAARAAARRAREGAGRS